MRLVTLLALLVAACGGGSSENLPRVADAGAAGLPAGYSALPYRAETPVRRFTAAEPVLEPGRDYVALLETDVGRILVDLYEIEAPSTVNSFVFLALHRFYEGVAFHRVIDNFMAQTGDPNTAPGGTGAWGTGGPGYSFGLEVNPALNYDGAGVLGMARTSAPDTNGSQFFITFKAYPSLNQQYTVWGRVQEGLDVLASIARGSPPSAPSRIVRVVIGSRVRP